MIIPGIYSQRDPLWSGMELGFNNDPAFNIYHYGCLVTAIANLLWETGNPNATPGGVNLWLKDNGGFVAGGGLVIWNAINPLLAQVNVTPAGYTTSETDTNTFLGSENNFAIIQLTAPGFSMHYAVAPYVGQIADSWDGVLKSLDGHYTFVAAHLYTKVVPELAPPTIVPTIPTPSASQPIVAPMPDPVVSVTTPVPDPAPTPTAAPAQPVDPLLAYGFTLDTKTLPILRTDAYAMDIVTGAKVDDIPLGTQVQTSGYFTYATQTYYRTQWSLDNLKTTVIPANFFQAASGYGDGPVTTRTTPTPAAADPVSTPEATEPTTPTFWEQFKASPLGALIRYIISRFR